MRDNGTELLASPDLTLPIRRAVYDLLHMRAETATVEVTSDTLLWHSLTLGVPDFESFMLAEAARRNLNLIIHYEEHRDVYLIHWEPK